MPDGRKRIDLNMTGSILKDKNCLVTGATGGLGKELCKLLIQKECNLFITSREKKNLERLKKSLHRINKRSNIFFCQADLRKSRDVEKLIITVKSKMQTIDILINCAGVFQYKSIQKLTYKDFDDSFNVNVRAPFILSKAFINNMLRKKWGRIINIGSSSSYSGFQNSSIYCSSKHALLGLSRALYEELKTKQVRVYSFSPGSIKTKMGKKILHQNYDTFMSAGEVASFIIFSISFDSQLMTNEIRLNRINPI